MGVRELALRSQAELAENLLVGDAFTAGKRCLGTIQCGDGLLIEIFFLEWSLCQRLGERLDHHLEKSPYGSDLLLRQSVQEEMSLLPLRINLNICHWLTRVRALAVVKIVAVKSSGSHSDQTKSK